MSLKKYHVDLTLEEQVLLQHLIQTRSSQSIQVKRAYVLLAADRNGLFSWSDQQIATTYGVTCKTVENIRQRFVEIGFETTLYGQPQVRYKEKVFTGDVEAHLIALRCSPPPAGYAHWTFQLLADQMVALAYVPHMSHEGARQILKKTK